MKRLLIILVSFICLLTGIVALLRPDLFESARIIGIVEEIRLLLPIEQRENETAHQTDPVEKRDVLSAIGHNIYTTEDIEKAKREVMAEKRREQAYGTGGAKSTLEVGQPVAASEVEERKHIYRIDLHTGGAIFTESIQQEEDSVTYQDKNGLVISIQTGEVKDVKKLRVRQDSVAPKTDTR